MAKDPFAVEKSVALEDIDWLAAEQFLMRRAKCDRDAAESELEKLRSLFRRPISLIWFRREPSKKIQTVIRSLLDAHSSDRLRISYNFLVPLLVPATVYSHVILVRKESPYLEIAAHIDVMRLQFKIDNPVSVMSMYIIILLGMGMIAGALTFLLVYGFSIFVILVDNPKAAITWSLREPKLLLSLLCFLTVLGGLSHRAVKNVVLEIRSWKRRKKP